MEIVTPKTDLQIAMETIALLTKKLEAKSDTRFKALRQGEKGTVVLAGIGKRGAAFYADQWERILARKDDILAFIEVHNDTLSRKPLKAAEEDAPQPDAPAVPAPAGA
jgi:hypothetical protein